MQLNKHQRRFIQFPVIKSLWNEFYILYLVNVRRIETLEGMLNLFYDNMKVLTYLKLEIIVCYRFPY
jgi:hypothetical protein